MHSFSRHPLLDPNSIDLPAYAHLPGVNGRHEEGFLDHVINLAPELTLSDGSGANIPWLFGLRLFDVGFFWEAHEVWEAVWLRAAPNSRERFLLQGMIHLTNAFLKQKCGQVKAAQRLKTLAEECFVRAFQGAKGLSVMGVDFQEVELLMMKL
jgi:uncharacterized protein